MMTTERPLVPRDNQPPVFGGGERLAAGELLVIDDRRRDPLATRKREAARIRALPTPS